MRPPGHLSSSEYAAQIGVAKSRVSAYLSRGMPYIDGKDDHGRDCKFIDPQTADWWRTQNLGVKVEGATGRVRGGIVQHNPGAPAPADPQGDAGAGQTGRRASSPKRSAGGAGLSPSGTAPPADSVRHDATRRIQAAKVSEAEDKALSARFRRLKDQGKLLDRTAFQDIFEAFVGKVAVTIDRMPQDMATVVASRLDQEEHPVYLALREVADRIRSDLATYAEQERDRLPVDEEPPEARDTEASLFGDLDEDDG